MVADFGCGGFSDRELYQKAVGVPPPRVTGLALQGGPPPIPGQRAEPSAECHERQTCNCNCANNDSYFVHVVSPRRSQLLVLVPQGLCSLPREVLQHRLALFLAALWGWLVGLLFLVSPLPCGSPLLFSCPCFGLFIPSFTPGDT